MEDAKKEYAPDEATVKLFKGYCNVEDPQEISRRAMQAQEAALRKFPYHCIQKFAFMGARSSRHPTYERLLATASSSPDRKVLDVGCCMGTDIRAMILDKFAARENIKGIDILGDFIEIGFTLFGEDRSSLPNTFVVGNVLDEKFNLFPDNSFDVIYCGSVYHLLDLEQTKLLSRVLYRLLAPEGTLFGRTVGLSNDQEPRLQPRRRRGPKEESSDAPQGESDSETQLQLQYLHTPKSLASLFEEIGYQDVEVVEGVLDLPLPTWLPDRSEETDKQRKMLLFTVKKGGK